MLAPQRLVKREWVRFEARRRNVYSSDRHRGDFINGAQSRIWCDPLPFTHHSVEGLSIVYRFRVRPVSITGGGRAAAFAPGQEEFTFDVTFAAAAASPKGGDAPVQQGTCRTPAGEVVTFLVNDDNGTTDKGLRVYAGCRSDPFLIDVAALRESFNTGRLAFKHPGTHTLAGANILGIVVEFDSDMLLASGRGPLFAIVGETITSGRLPIRLERFGRPEVKNFLLGPRSQDR